MSRFRTNDCVSHQDVKRIEILYHVALYKYAPNATITTNNNDFTKVVKFADDTTVEGLVRDAGESAYREEVRGLVSWCDNNSLNLINNSSKSREVMIDFRRNKTLLDPLFICGQRIEVVGNFKFLGTAISNDLSMTNDQLPQPECQR